MSIYALPRHRRPLHPSEAFTGRDAVSMANHDHSHHAPSCAACDPREYAEMDARHRSDA